MGILSDMGNFGCGPKRDGTKLILRSFMMQQDNDPKQNTKTTKEFIGGKKWKVLDWPSQFTDFNPIEHAFFLLKRELREKKPRKQTTTERGSKVKLHKIRMKRFGDVSGSQA